MTILFRPVGIIAGILAGLAARKLFEKSWGVVDSEDPPAVEERFPGLPKLAIALILEGAIFSLVRGMVDHGARVGFKRYTGAWPGEDPKND